MGLNAVRTAQDVSRACGGQTGAGATQPPAQAPAQSQFALRAHDAWALPIDVVRDALGVTFFEQELFDDFQACLISRRGRTIVITAPGLTAEMKQHAVRRLFSEHIANGWAAVSVDSEERVKFAESLDAEADPEGGPVGVPASTALAQADVRGLYEGSAYVPLHGWRDDEEVIAALRTLITDSLAGTAEDFPDAAYPLPDGVGATVAIGYDDQGAPHPLVWVRADIPNALRADLWGYCVALSAGFEEADIEPDENGVFYVGMERAPVTGPGVALLAAVMVQRMGRRPGDCAFPLLAAPA